MVRGPISLVVVSVIMLATIGLVFGGPRILDGILPPRAMEMVESLLPNRAGPGAPNGDGSAAEHYLLDAADGLVARGPIAASVGNRPVFIKDAISGYATQVEAEVPAEITTIRPILGCRLTPPMEGAVVAHVVAGTSGLRSALSTYNDQSLAAAVQDLVNHYRSSGAKTLTIEPPPPYEVYDVAVTETGGPVYLVLENLLDQDRLWNIHLAEGARIERVILLGGNQAGVANLDPVVPVEVLLAPGMESCGIVPGYPLNSGHLFFQSMAGGTMTSAEAQTKLAVLAAQVEAYDVWFRDTFGVPATTSRIGFDRGTVSVVGPVPGEAGPKATYRPISGSKIRATQDQFFEIRGQVAEGEDFADRVTAIATTFAFGNLDYLRQGAEF